VLAQEQEICYLARAQGPYQETEQNRDRELEQYLDRAQF
jgi:hypothetical protein